MASMGWNPYGDGAGTRPAPAPYPGFGYPPPPATAAGPVPVNLRRILVFALIGLLVAVAASMTALYAGALASTQVELRDAQAQASAAQATSATDKKVGAVLQAYATTVGAAQKALMAEIQANGNADAQVALQDELDTLAGPKAAILGANLPAALQPSLADVQQAFTDLVTAVQTQLSGMNANSDSQIGTGILDEQSATQRLSSAVATLQSHLGA